MGAVCAIFSWETSIALEPTPVELGAKDSALDAGKYPLANLTGIAACHLNDAQIEAECGIMWKAAGR